MDAVSPVIELVIVILLPTAVGCAIIVGFRGLGWSSERWRARRHPLYAPAEPIERLGASLRRLRAELDATETRSDIHAKNLRLKALRGAYVDALIARPASGLRSPRRAAATGPRCRRSTGWRRRCGSAAWTSGRPAAR